MANIIKKIINKIKKCKGGLDMTRNDVYIWYSGATDITGQKLVNELKVTGGKKKPAGKGMVIGWGTKTNDNVTIPGAKVLNHPNEIRSNRNKFATLQRLGAEKDMVAPFIKANDIMRAMDNVNSPICLPLVGRTNYHQGGKGFWICLTKSHVRNALDEGAQYFQNYIDIKDEFRVHVFEKKVVCAQKKVKRNNVEEAYIEQHTEKIENIAGKNDRVLDKETLKYTLGRLAKENLGVDMIVRSNRKGWKFSHVKTINKDMEKLAVKALKAIGLDFGAVDCCVDAEGKPWIIEINSGPGLDGTTLKAYVEKFNAVVEDFVKPPVVKTPKRVTARAPIAAKKNVREGLDNRSRLDSDSAKDRLLAMRDLLSLVADADEAESRAVEGLLERKIIKRKGA